MCLLFSESNHWISVLAVKNSWVKGNRLRKSARMKLGPLSKLVPVLGNLYLMYLDLIQR